MQPDRLSQLVELEADTAKFLKVIRILIAHEKAARLQRRSHLRLLTLIPIGGAATLAHRWPKITSALGGGLVASGATAAALIPVLTDECPPGALSLPVPTSATPATPTAPTYAPPSAKPSPSATASPSASGALDAPPAVRPTVRSSPPASAPPVPTRSTGPGERPTPTPTPHRPSPTPSQPAASPPHAPQRSCIRVIVRVERGRLEVRVWCGWKLRQ